MILVLSGTKDGRVLLDKLKVLGEEIIVSTATAYGASLVDSTCFQVVNGTMNEGEMAKLIDDRGITLVVDATHPYAKDVSINAMKASQDKEVPYYRYERPSSFSKVKSYKSYSRIVEELEKREGNILLTIGSNNLEQFKSLIARNRIYARVLPTTRVMEKCDVLGLGPKFIIAMQGPFSKLMNEAMYKQYNIEAMVTKETSDIGGFNEKVESALENDVEVFVLERPLIPYDNLYNSMDALIEAVKNNL